MSHSTTSRHYFHGKYIGKVADNCDPLIMRRIRAQVPAVFGTRETGWTLPCVPYAGHRVGFFFIPPVNSNVWIEFENGNAQNPIWSGWF
jgi:hypothetical protein